MNTKSITLFFICMLSAFYMQSQRKKMLRLNHFESNKIKYGFYLGGAYKGYELKGNQDVALSQGFGFQLGVLADWNFSEYLSLISEPGILSTSNKLLFDNTTFDITSTHFRLPLSIKFKTRRINNIRTYLQTGLGYSYNFNTDRNKGNGGTNPNEFEFTKHNLSGELSIGANFYFHKFKFTPSIKGVYGFNNEYNGLGTTAIEEVTSLKTRAILVGFTFQ